jgi:polyribonucleotide nucleotidyltransferase
MQRKIFKQELGGKELKVEVNNMAEQASGSVLVQYGDTLILATATMAANESPNQGFFPLTVEYEERFYAAGKILGSRFVRRESKPSDDAILTSRLIDRAIRPRFPKNLKREVQVILTCLSWDGENDPDVIGLVAASLALGLSNIPWLGPLATLRVGRENESFVINPTYAQREKSDLDLVVSAMMTEGKEMLLNMIEAGSEEVEEKMISEAIKFAKLELEKLINFQKEIIKELGKPKTDSILVPQDQELEKDVKEFLQGKLDKVLFQPQKTERTHDLTSLKDDLLYFIAEKYAGTATLASKMQATRDIFEAEIDKTIHENIIKEEKRPDGRKIDQLRDIEIEAGLLPRTHGSGLFCRGQTKALSILTLGSPSDVKLLEGMETRGKKRFMHHYNFPPYCSGEVKPLRGPGRREIGHGMLAEKALLPLVPDFEEFPYTMRVVTEILSSNGSSSMASVSGSSLALMDAGVPIKRPAAGIAMGLMKNDQGDYKVLTDIQGPEDHHGDMDFKIAGTDKGITAIQMDVKIDGINQKILEEALERGKHAREQILEKISKVLDKPRPQLSPFAPRIIILQINPAKIREVIGPGGKIINEIIEECGVSIDIEDTGKIFITAEKEEAGQKATEWIKNITHEVKAGEMFQGKVKRILEFGAFVEILPGQEGLVHISQLSDGYVKKVEDVVKIGDIIPVKVIAIDEQGRINLSLKEAKK